MYILYQKTVIFLGYIYDQAAKSIYFKQHSPQKMIGIIQCVIPLEAENNVPIKQHQFKPWLSHGFVDMVISSYITISDLL